MSHKTIKNYVSTYNTNAICIFTTVKPAEFKSGALFLKHPVDGRLHLVGFGLVTITNLLRFALLLVT